MATKIVKCPSCNTENTGLENFCRNCGTTLADPFQNEQNQPNQQMQQPQMQSGAQIPGADKKILAGILAIVIGGFGVHKFILGYQQEGIILVASWLIAFAIAMVTCGIGTPLIFIPSVIGIIEGIIYLTKSDEEFVQTYINNKKPWF